MHSGKIVLVSSSGYSQDLADPLLQKLIESQIELFCVVGVDAEKWEDALDWLCVGADGSGTQFITTTSHPGESEAEVIEFAKSFSTKQLHEVEVIRV